MEKLFKNFTKFKFLKLDKQTNLHKISFPSKIIWKNKRLFFSIVIRFFTCKIFAGTDKLTLIIKIELLNWIPT